MKIYYIYLKQAGRVADDYMKNHNYVL